MNNFFSFQMPNLEIYGSSLTRITLTECEFVHPQTLNPLARLCPNLIHLALENPSTVPDDLFVGEVNNWICTYFKISRQTWDKDYPWIVTTCPQRPLFFSPIYMSFYTKSDLWKMTIYQQRPQFDNMSFDCI